MEHHERHRIESTIEYEVAAGHGVRRATPAAQGAPAQDPGPLVPEAGRLETGVRPAPAILLLRSRIRIRGGISN